MANRNARGLEFRERERLSNAARNVEPAIQFLPKEKLPAGRRRELKTSLSQSDLGFKAADGHAANSSQFARWRLGVFLKEPKPGFVKTRLAASMGEESAARLYAGWVGRIFQSMQVIRDHADIVAIYDGELGAMKRWMHLADRWFPQTTGDLGARLDAVFSALCVQDSPTVVIGTDCLDLNANDVSRAAALLGEVDMAIGPASDGGYYLIACRRFFPGLFESIRWSTENAFADQFSQARRLGLKIAILPERDDIDDWDDWTRYCRRVDRDPMVAQFGSTE